MSTNIDDDPMQPEYDFSQGRRGQFYKPNIRLNLPVYLEAEVLDYLTALAKKRGVQLSDLTNDLLRKDIAIIEAGK